MSVVRRSSRFVVGTVLGILGSGRGEARALRCLAASLSHQTDSLLLCAGGLQLLPENATKWLRFSRLVETARATRASSRQEEMGLAELEMLLTDRPVAAKHVLDNEDPFEGPFVAPVCFESVEYLALPGATADAATVCQFLLDAVDELREDAAEAYGLMQRDAARLLWVSDLVVRRAGLGRWKEPKYDKDDGVHIPEAGELNRLKAAVSIDDVDVEPFGGVAGFSDLCWPRKRVHPRRDHHRLADDRHLVYPLSLASDSKSLIVPAPNQLALSLVHRIALHATRCGAQSLLMSAFERHVLAEAEGLCVSMNWTPLEPLVTLEAHSGVSDALIAYDLDKIAHVVVLADDLDGYETGRPHAPTDTRTRLLRIRTRMEQARDAVAALDAESHVFHLLVVAPIGRPMFADFASLEGNDWSVLMLSIDELRTIAHHERDDPLGLWRFAVDRWRLPLDHSVSSAIDAYALYLELGRRPPELAQGDRPVVLFLIGNGAPLTVQQRQLSDVHANRLPNSSEVAMVQRVPARSAAPVYVPRDEDLSPLRLIELVLPIWVEADGSDPRSQAFCQAVADAVAHHLWRIRGSIDGCLQAITKRAAAVVIEIADPDAVALTFCDPEDSAGTPWFEIAVEPDEQHVRVLLLANAAARLADVDRHAEGTLVAEVVRALGLLTRESIDGADARLTDLDVRAMPRFMHVSVGDAPHIHGGAAGPGCRLKHHRELDAVSREIDSIALGLGVGFGVVPAERRAEVTDEIVRVLDDRLRAGMRELDPVSTFVMLVSEQERMHQDRTRLAVVTPNPFTGETEEEFTRSALEKFHQINIAAPASRYLVETAVHGVRAGRRPLSLSRYDELLAISQHLVQLGSYGAAFRAGLSDAEVRLSEQGQLVIGHTDPYSEAVRDYADAGARSLAAHDTLAEWARYSQDHDLASPPSPRELGELSEAFESEFGVPLNGFLRSVERLRELAADSGLGVMRAPVHDLHNDLMTTAELTARQAASMLDMLSLKADPDATEADLLDTRPVPWRFGRENSFLRRPLLSHDLGTDTEMALWGSQMPCIAAGALFEQVFTGRLQARTAPMQKYISRHRNWISRNFEDEVAETFRRNPHNRVRVRATSLGNTSLKHGKGATLGDIDVLVVNEHQRTVLIIEAKSFAATRTPSEVRSEIDKLTLGARSAVARHLARVGFVRDRWPLLHRQMKLSGHSSDWWVREMVVTSSPSIGADLLRRRGDQVGTPIVPFAELSI